MSTRRPSVRRTMYDTNSGNFTFGTGWALGPTFKVFTDFQPYSKLKIFYHFPMRNDSGSWGGGYIEPQISINGEAYTSLGSCGYDGGVMALNAYAILCYNNTIFFDPKMSGIYTVQLRFWCRSYDGTLWLNYNRDINAVSGTAPAFPGGETQAQFYCHVVIDEVVV